MKRTIWLYGLALALLTAFLKAIEYRYRLRDLSTEFYVTLIALLFTGLGIWMGRKLSKKYGQAPAAASFVPLSPTFHTAVDPEQFGLSPREYEVLQLIAQGLTNQEIADKLFISLNTVKTHSSNLFAKLDARRRTQAVRKAKEMGLL